MVKQYSRRNTTGNNNAQVNTPPNAEANAPPNENTPPNNEENGQPNEDIPLTEDDIETPEPEVTLIAILQGIHKQQADFQQALLQQQAGYGPRVDPGIRQFRGLHPKSFTGKEPPLEAEEWKKSMEVDLTAAQIPKHRWVEIGRMQLTQIARIWWEAEEARLTKPISWETFVERFNAKYFSEMARMDLQERFVKLKQGDMTVDEYDAEFSMLSRFAEHLVASPITRATLFRRGLNLAIQASMTSAKLETHEAVLNAARESERIQREIKAAQPVVMKTQSSTEASTKPVHTTSFKRTGAQTNGSEGMTCFYCGRQGHKKNNCWEFLGLCMACGSDAHKLRDCPRRRTGEAPTNNQGQRGGAQTTNQGQHKGAPLSTQQQAYQQGKQKNTNRQAFTMEVVAGNPESTVRPTLNSMLADQNRFG